MRVTFCPKELPHIEQTKRLSFSWTVSICVCKLRYKEKEFPQILQSWVSFRSPNGMGRLRLNFCKVSSFCSPGNFRFLFKCDLKSSKSLKSSSLDSLKTSAASKFFCKPFKLLYKKITFYHFFWLSFQFISLVLNNFC